MYAKGNYLRCAQLLFEIKIKKKTLKNIYLTIEWYFVYRDIETKKKMKKKKIKKQKVYNEIERASFNVNLIFGPAL